MLELSRDGWLLLATCSVRSFAYGFLSVVLGLYLDAIGLDKTSIGWIFTAALAGGAVMTVILTAVADSIGRRALLILGALTVVVLLARHLLSQLDVPTRQSYTMAVVDPGERAASAGILSVARNVGAAIAPLFTGPILAAPSLGLPFLLAGGLKIIYDLWIFALFRKVKPPEELGLVRRRSRPFP